MNEVLLVAFGGALGSCSRYLLSGYVLNYTFQQKFPYGTFTVNIFGCLLAGLLVGFVEKHQMFSQETRLFLLTGIIGGFTTFSAFGVETVQLLRRGDFAVASAYVILSLLCGFLVLWFAYSVVPLKNNA
jgi:CrcB protein